MPRAAPAESEVVGYLKTLSNWGRWGRRTGWGRSPVNLVALF